MRSPCCLCVCVSPSYQLLNSWTNIYETWYVYQSIWAHHNGLLHKSVSAVCVALCLPPAFTLVSCSAYFSTLKMAAICSSETWVDSQRTIQRYIPEDGTLHNHRCEDLKSCILVYLSNKIGSRLSEVDVKGIFPDNRKPRIISKRNM
jgi:hypothetical protein